MSTCARYIWAEDLQKHRERFSNQDVLQKFYLGTAVQVDPINLTLKAPETKRLKHKCDELLSTPLHLGWQPSFEGPLDMLAPEAQALLAWP